MPGEKILVVEDNEKNRKLIRVILKSKGYELIEADDAEKALELLNNNLRPDLILMDIGLPGMDGLELTRQIKQNELTKNIPVIAVTAHAMRGDEEKILAAGCDNYISKPIKVGEFPGTIEELLQKYKK